MIGKIRDCGRIVMRRRRTGSVWIRIVYPYTMKSIPLTEVSSKQLVDVSKD